MTEHQDSQNFAELFKKYRLRSQIGTLSQFGDLFAEEGMIYENSLFTRWQNGQRVPHDRRTILALIRLFVKRKGIVSLDEANGLLKVVGLCDLSGEEVKKIGLQFAELKSSTNEVKKIASGKNLYINIEKIPTFNIQYLSKSRYVRYILLLFCLNSMWLLRIQFNNLYNSFESYIWGLSYSLIPLSSGFLLFRNKDLFLKTKSPWGDISRLLIFGLVFQGLGLITWTYYNLTGIQVPYPSFADFGYLTTAICYLLASKATLSANFPKLNRLIQNNKSYAVFLPFLVLLSTSLNYMQIFDLSFEKQLRLIFDFAYPFIEVLTIFIVVCGIVFSEFKNKNIIHRNFLLLAAFTSHFISEYLFVLSVKNGKYMNGGTNDFLYLFSYTLMSVAIVAILPLIKIKYFEVWSEFDKNHQFNYHSSMIQTHLKQAIRKYLIA